MRSLSLPIALLLALAVAAPAGAAFRGTNGVLAYEGRASASGAILLAPHGGGGARRLGAPGKPSDPAFSPLGRRIAFASRSEIWVMFEDGTSVRQVTVGPEPARDPTWSPEADAIAYARGYAGDRDLYSVGADGNGARQLTTGRYDDWAPAWGPSGAIAFVRDGDIYSRRAGAAPGRVSGGAADDRDPVWSPDGRRIAFTRLGERAPARKGKKRRRPARLRELWVMRANGSHARRLRKLPADVSSPAWSPDGRAIAFAMGRSGRRGLYTVRTTGGGLRQVASRAADPRAIDWQARGRDPVIAAAGDIACDPDLTRFATGLGTSNACHMLQTSDLLLKMDLVGGAAARRPPVRERHPGQVPALLRPDLGAAEGADAPGRRATTSTAPPARPATSTTSTAPGSPTAPRARATRATTPTTSAPGTSSRSTRSAPTRRPTTPTRTDCAAGSAQEQWLRADLAAHPAALHARLLAPPAVQLRLARGQRRAVQPLFQALHDGGVEVLLTGHDHGYERFAPMDADANRDGARGVRQFVVGTGGKNEGSALPQPNSEVRGPGRSAC